MSPYQLRFDVDVKDDLASLDSAVKIRIRHTIHQKLLTHPELYGAPLRQSLKGYRKLRVGDYRVVYRLEQRTVTVLIIGHRSMIYKLAEKRLH